MKPRSLSLVLFGMIWLSTDLRGEEPSRQEVEFFETKIRPVLVNHCYRCHAQDAKKIRGGLLLDTKAGLLKGGETGPAIVPGNAKKSLLIQAIQHQGDLEMPPKGALPKNVIADFVKWVDNGAADPRGGKVKIVQKKIDVEKGRQYWAFQPVRKVDPPAVKHKTWARTAIDQFLLAKMEAEGLTPAADADRRLLARRIYFDLIGLPPTPKQVDDFLADGSPKAVENLVDRLLKSPQFGERWGRHWLDVARFAESNGNVDNTTFPHAWRYRNYVIDAVNNDVPFPQFIKEQIAGDLLEGKTAEERNRLRIATGFLALASKPRSQNNPNFAMDVVADQIEVTTRSALAITVACARCHDHKFDPIPTADYYALAGIFNSTETLYGAGGRRGRGITGGLHVLEELGKKTVVQAPKPAPESQPDVTFAELKRRQKQVNQQLKKLRNKKNANDPTVLKLTKELQEIRAQVRKVGKKKGKGNAAPIPSGAELAMGVREKGQPSDCRINVRGEARNLGDAVPRGFVQVATIGDAPTIDAKQSGRLQLAEWIGSDKNPLTARVMVNRIWVHLFGEGIVRTPDNFGVNGERPTHPELLDHLAIQFMQDDWSTKKMIRRLMLTRAYQMSSVYNAGHFAKDPDNLYVWRMAPRRLDAESFRDSILTVSGQLNLSRPKGSVVTRYAGRAIQDNLSIRAFDEDNVQRSVYLPIVRNGVPEMLRLFDFADPSLVVGKRNVTSVPGQELYLMNSPFVQKHARHFAERLKAKDEPKERVELAYRLAWTRSPTQAETERALAYVAATEQSLNGIENDADKRRMRAWASLCQALLVSSEFRYLD